MIRIGPAGWAYKDWSGIVYPAPKPRGFDPLRYWANYFNTVEINTSFYGPITAKTAAGWVEKIAHHPHFRFTAKLWQGFTHERNAGNEDERLVKDGLAPLLEAGRLGAVLMQFPWSYRNTDENRASLTRLRERFPEYPLILEVRHASWNEPGILDLLEQLEIGMCNIDQPLFKRSIKPAAVITGTTGYVRLHGVITSTGSRKRPLPHERYDYLYPVNELDPWIDRIKAVAQGSTDTYAISNNHYLGKAAVNALEISSILKGQSVPAPPELVTHYPVLKEFTTGSPLSK
ncbi:MAG: DUF72 domain-containing protein [Acidobacteriota bacterium]|nr:DUF72 domain-containing protein [Acidobacteriota bacterium]